MVRHGALSRVAETGKFSIPELQVFSGHRDVRMLMRYAHLCASKLASKLDECFKDEAKFRVHRGRKVLNKHAIVKVKDVVEASQSELEPDIVAAPPEAPAATVAPASEPMPSDATPQVSNVIPFRPRLRA